MMIAITRIFTAGILVGGVLGNTIIIGKSNGLNAG